MHTILRSGADMVYVHTLFVNEKARRLYEGCGFSLAREETPQQAKGRGGCLDGIEGRARIVLLKCPVELGQTFAPPVTASVPQPVTSPAVAPPAPRPISPPASPSAPPAAPESKSAPSKSKLRVMIRWVPPAMS